VSIDSWQLQTSAEQPRMNPDARWTRDAMLSRPARSRRSAPTRGTHGVLLLRHHHLRGDEGGAGV